MKSVEVAAVCDLPPAQAQATVERFQWHSDFEQLLAEVKPDLVHVTTPRSSHSSIAKACLSAGLNVLCEKPITTDYWDFKLKQLAVQNGCMLMENQNLRFHTS